MYVPIYTDLNLRPFISVDLESNAFEESPQSGFNAQGFLRIREGVFEICKVQPCSDAYPKFEKILVGQVVQILKGPNKGYYKIAEELSHRVDNEGKFWFRFRPSLSIFRLNQRMGHQLKNQAYQVSVDLLGQKEPKVLNENKLEEASSQFWIKT